MHRKRSRGRRLTDEERSEKRATERKLMADAVQSLRSSEGWQRWLSLRRHFHTYSFANQLLIAFQMPHATRVAGFHDWKRIGYAVRKGEHGIRIWAPCKPSKKRMKQWREEGADPQTRPKVFFRMVSVFDRTQVDPIPGFPEPVDLDPPLAPIEGDGLARFLLPLQAFAGSIGFGFAVEPTPPGVDGYCDLKESRIVVRPVGEDFSPNAQVSTAVHEVSHAIVSLDDADDRPQLTRAEEEVVVECVVFWRDRSIRGSGAGCSVGDGCHRRRCRGARPARSASPRVARLRRAVGVAEGPRGAGPDRGGDDDGCQEETDRGRA